MPNLCRHLFATLFAFIFISVVSAQDDPTVYVTKTGTKYHLSSCSSLRKSTIPLKLSVASKEYSACLRCNPPTASEETKLSATDPKTDTLKKSDNESPSPKRAGETQVGTTPKGHPIYEGPRGGRYHYSKSGKKVYERKKR